MSQTKLTINGLTNDSIETELSEDEILELRNLHDEIESNRASKEAAKASARAKLAALGLTEEEIAAL
jgi:hypothetical protein